MRIDGAGRLGGGSWPVISWTIKYLSVVVMSRFGTIDWEFGGGRSDIGGRSGTAPPSSWSITDAKDKEISSSTGRALIRSRETVIYR
jgi:hypothetical protein